jgi:hypothetical protein
VPTFFALSTRYCRPCLKSWLRISDFTPQEKDAALREIRKSFGNTLEIEDEDANFLRGFIECYHDEMLQNGWEWQGQVGV